MPRAAVQLYTVRDVRLSVPELLERVSKAGFDGVELAYRLPKADPVTVRTVLDDNGLANVGAHVPFDLLVDEFETTVERYRDVNCTTLVVPRLDEPHFESIDSIEASARTLSDLGERLSERGFELLYHNHAHEFRSLDDGTAFSRLVELTDETVGFELDLGLATKAGQNPVALLREYAGRISIVHVTDTHVASPDRDHVELGEGDVALANCIDAAREAAVEWCVFEHGQSVDQLETLRRGGERLAAELSP